MTVNLGQSIGQSIGRHSENAIREVQRKSTEGLRKVIERPFEPSAFNPEFDLKRWVALIEIARRDKSGR